MKFVKKLANWDKNSIHNLILERICSIINFSRVKKTLQKGEWIYILKKKLKYYTKEVLKYFNITIIAFGFIIAIILIKYKPMYKVSVSGTELGYVQNKEALEEIVKENMLEKEEKNVDTIDIQTNPEYELKLVDRTTQINEEEMIATIEKDVIITYKYYEIALDNQAIDSVNTLEEAEELIEQIKKDNTDKELDLSIIEKYTQNEEEIKTTELEIAKLEAQSKIEEQIAKQKEKEEQEAMPEISGIKLATKPIVGTITSRYGERSSIRSSTHTGLDIAATTGTPIQVVADGTVTSASYNGSYGNLVKVDHGNGIETWYAHTSKMYVTVGQTVTAGEVIATVGSTGNSTGPHLHFEIRMNGEHVNPQNYLYK